MPHEFPFLTVANESDLEKGVASTSGFDHFYCWPGFEFKVVQMLLKLLNLNLRGTGFFF